VFLLLDDTEVKETISFSELVDLLSKVLNLDENWFHDN
jgi:hypothetical protein